MLKLRGSATETEEDAEAAAATAAEVYRRKLKPKAKSKQICEQFIIFQFQALSFRRCQHGFDRDNQHRPTEEEEGEAVAAAPVCGVTMASPDEGMNCPVSILKVVVFPAPLTPRSPKHSPSGTATDTPRTARTTLPSMPGYRGLHSFTFSST
jgi:hypothetical protein